MAALVFVQKNTLIMVVQMVVTADAVAISFLRQTTTRLRWLIFVSSVRSTRLTVSLAVNAKNTVAAVRTAWFECLSVLKYFVVTIC